MAGKRGNRFKSVGHRIKETSFDEKLVAAAAFQGYNCNNDDSTESHLSDAIAYWHDLNLTEHFTSLRRSIEPYTQSLPLIIHYKDSIYREIVKSIELADDLSFEPIGAIICNFARDLQFDFLQYITPIIEACYVLMLSKDSMTQAESLFDLSEKIFLCITFLFKFFKKHIAQDDAAIFQILKLTQDLWKNDRVRPYLLRFSAEGIAFLWKSLSHYEKRQEELAEVIFHEPCLPGNCSEYPRIVFMKQCMRYSFQILSSRGKAALKSFTHMANLVDVNCYLASNSAALLVSQSDFYKDPHLFRNVLQYCNECQNTNGVYLCLFLFSIYNSPNETVPIDINEQSLEMFKNMLYESKYSYWATILFPCIATKASLQSQNLANEFPAIQKLLMCHISQKLKLVPSIKLFRSPISFKQDIDIDPLPTILISQIHYDLFKDRSLYFDTFDEKYLEAAFNSLKPDERIIYEHIFAQHCDISTDSKHDRALTLLQSLLDLSDTEIRLNSRYFHLISQDIHKPLESHLFGKVVEYLSNHESDVFVWSGFNAMMNNFEISCLKRQKKKLSELCLRGLWNCNTVIRKAALNLAELYVVIDNADLQIQNLFEFFKAICNYKVDLLNIRELQMQYCRLEPMLQNCTFSENTFDIFFHALFGQLFLSVTPLWPNVTKVLSVLMKKSSERGFSLLNQISKQDNAVANNDFSSTSADTSSYQQKTILSYLSSKTRTLFSINEDIHSMLNSRTYLLEKALASTQDEELASLTLRHPNVKSQVYRTLLGCSDLLNERHIMPYLDDLVNEEITRDDRLYFVEMLSGFPNNILASARSKLYPYLIRSIVTGDTKLQCALLRLIAKVSQISKPSSSFFIDLSEAKDVSHSINIFWSDSSKELPDKEKLQVEVILLRVIYGRLLHSRKDDNFKRRTDRNSLLQLLPLMSKDSFERFVYLMFTQLAPELEQISNLEDICSNLENIQLSFHRMLGYQRLSLDIIDVFKFKLPQHIQHYIGLAMLSMLRQSESNVKDDSLLAESALQAMKKNVRQTSFKILRLIYEINSNEDDSNILTSKFFDYYLNTRISTISVELAHNVSHLQKIFLFWSENSMFIPYLFKYNDNLIPQLTSTSNLDSINTEVLKVNIEIIRNITFDLQNTEIAPNIQKYMSEIIAFVKSCILLFNQNKKADYSFEPLYTIVMRVSQYIKPEDASTFVTLITKILSMNHTLSKTSEFELLDSLKQLQNNSTDLICVSEEVSSPYFILSSLFLKAKDRVHTINLLLEIFSKIPCDSDCLTKLNARSTTRLDEIDYETVIDKLVGISEVPSLHSSIESLPVWFCLLYHIQNKSELSLRAGSSLSLKKIVQNRNSAVTIFFRQCFLAVVKRLLKDANKETEQAQQTEPVLSEIFMVLSHCARELKDVQVYNELAVLSMADEEASFFNNAFHIQLHRRVRCINRLKQISRHTKFSVEVVTSILFPYLRLMQNYSKSDQLTEESLDAYAVLTLQLPVTKYFKSLDFLLKADITQRKLINRNVRLIIKMVDYYIDSICDEDTESQRLISEVNSLTSAEAGSVNTNLLTYLTKFLFSKNNTEGILLYLPIAKPCSRIISLFPQQNSDIPDDGLQHMVLQLISFLANIAKSRDQDVRDALTNTIADTSFILGPKYLKFYISTLKSTLTRGYQRHVLANLVHKILLRYSDGLVIESSDLACLIFKIILDSLIGIVGEEKDDRDYISKMKEIKVGKSYHSFELLAQILSMDQHVQMVYSLMDEIEKNSSPKVLGKIQSVLIRVIEGTVKNSFAQSNSFLIYIFAVQKEVVQRSSTRLRFSRNSFIFHDYVLRLLSLAIKKIEWSTDQEVIQCMLKTLGECIVQDQMDIKVSAIKCMQQLLSAAKIDAVTIKSELALFADQAIDIIGKSPELKNDHSQSCLKFLASIIRLKDLALLPEKKIIQLITRIQSELDLTDYQGNTFAVIRAFLTGHYVFPEIYNIAADLRKFSITSHSQSIRTNSRELYMKFLLEYPHTKLRLQTELQFLCTNLEYELVSGRKSALELIYSVCLLFNQSHLDDNFILMFVSLLRTSVIDEEPECRRMAEKCLKTLMKRSKSLDVSSRLCSSWLKEEDNPTFCKLGIMGLAYLSEFSDEYLNKALEAINRLICSPKAINDWEILYSTLISFEKICRHSSEATISMKASNIWECVILLVNHKHKWIKAISYRLIGILFSELKYNDMNDYSIPLPFNANKPLTKADICNFSQLFVNHVFSEQTDEAIKIQAVKNLAFISKRMQNYEKEAGFEAESRFALNEDNIFRPLMEDYAFENIFDLKSLLDLCCYRFRIILDLQDDASYEAKLFMMRYFVVLIQIIEPSKYLDKLLEPPLKIIQQIVKDSKKHNQIKELANELLSNIRDVVPEKDFTTVHGKLQQLANDKRTSRKHKLAMDAIKDPRLVAHRKMLKHKKKKVNVNA